MSEEIGGVPSGTCPAQGRVRLRRLTVSRRRRTCSAAIAAALLIMMTTPVVAAGPAWAAAAGSLAPGTRQAMDSDQQAGGDPVQVTIPFSGSDPDRLAVDRDGDVFISQAYYDGSQLAWELVELPWHGVDGYAAQQTLATALTAPGVAADFSGNLFIQSGTLELPAKFEGYAPPVDLPWSSLHGPGGVAVDHADDVFVADAGNVEELPDGPQGYGTQVTLPFPWPTGYYNDVALDSSGDVYAADTANERVLELPAGASASVALPFTGLSDPAHIAVDPAGDVFVADEDSNQVLELPAGSATPVTLPFTGLDDPLGVAVGPDGSVYVADNGNNRVVELSQYVPTTTAITSVSPASPTAGQAFTVSVALTPAYGLPPGGDVVVSDGAAESCTAGIRPATGTGSCTLTEQTPGPYTLTASYDGLGAFASSTGTASLTVAPITVSVQGSQLYGAASADFTQVNDAPSGVTITGAVSCATVNGGEPIGPGLGAGSYTIDGASCSGLSASTGSALSYAGGAFTVSPAAQSISFAGPGTGTVGGSATLSATGGGSGNPVVFSVDSSSGTGVCAVSGTNGSTVSYAAAGSCVIDANQAGSANYTAAPQDSQAITVSPAAQSISFAGPGTGTVGGSATLSATGGGSGNPVVFSVDASSGTGVCAVSGTNGSTVSYAAAGSCVIDASQTGNADYTAAPTVTATVTVNQAPAFVISSPPLTAVAGQLYDYTFEASGIPAPSYALASGAPAWLSVNSGTGEVSGTPPAGTTSFSYSVTAANAAGAATAGPFTITVGKASSSADLSAVLSCPASLTVGGTGVCTLTVANAGPAAASKVIAGIALPAALSQVSCSTGCSRLANVDAWTLASLASGASAKFSVTVKASRIGTATVVAAAASQSPDPKPLNNVGAAQVTVKH